jgi:predicted ATPase
VDYRLIAGEAKSAAPTHEPLPHSAPKRFWLVSPKLDATATVDADKVDADKVEADKIQTEMADAFQRCAPNIRPTAFTLNLNQRDWVLDKTLPSAVYIDFSALAEADHAFDDYRALVQTFPIVFLTHVPRFDAANRDACRRFMAFIDILYDGGGELYMAAQSVPADLYQDASCKLPFARTASRLAELL